MSKDYEYKPSTGDLISYYDGASSITERLKIMDQSKQEQWFLRFLTFSLKRNMQNFLGKARAIQNSLQLRVPVELQRDWDLALPDNDEEHPGVF